MEAARSFRGDYKRSLLKMMCRDISVIAEASTVRYMRSVRELSKHGMILRHQRYSRTSTVSDKAT